MGHSYLPLTLDPLDEGHGFTHQLRRPTEDETGRSATFLCFVELGFCFLLGTTLQAGKLMLCIRARL